MKTSPTMARLCAVLGSLCVVAWIPPPFPIDTRVAQDVPSEVYGPPESQIKIRISNGGAGPTGVLRALAEDYLQKQQDLFRIAWYQNITRLTLQTLERNGVDVGLVYQLPAHFAAGKYALAFYDHFLIVGPKRNLAGLDANDTPVAAFAKIAHAASRFPQQIQFLSRDDGSGTNERERLLWQLNGLTPWYPSAAWYNRYSTFPSSALERADFAQGYTLTDRGTWLTRNSALRNSQVFVQGGLELLNPCYVVVSAHASANALDFFEYIIGPRGQAVIKAYGTENGGPALFTPASEQEFSSPL